MYDDFLQLKQKDMSKTMSDMTYKYINPETNQPTKVPASHYDKELSREVERTVAQATNRQFLSIMYSQLNALRKEDPKYFFQALICMDNNLNPKDLRGFFYETQAAPVVCRSAHHRHVFGHDRAGLGLYLPQLLLAPARRLVGRRGQPECGPDHLHRQADL